MNLNLGSNDRNFPEFLSVDIVPPADVVTDLAQRWPWADSSVQSVKAFDIIEHIEDKIHFMNELYRVLAPGGRAEIEVPNASHGAGAWQDPTHKSYWTMNSFMYFEQGTPEHKRFAESYGITAKFKVLSMSEREYKGRYEMVYKIKALLEAVK